MTIRCTYSNEDDEIVFDYGDALSPITSTGSSGSGCSLSPSTSPCGFPGDALVGFACGLLHAAGKLLQTQATPSWMSSSCADNPFSIQPQKPSLTTPAVCPTVLYPCANHLAKGIHVSDVTQYPGDGLLDGDHVPTPTDNLTPHIMAVKTSLLATSLMSQVALLGCRDLTHSPILHPAAVPVHAAYAFIIHDHVFTLILVVYC